MIKRIIAWNKARYDQEHNAKLTKSLLVSELLELQEAEGKVDRVDACIDIIYVSIGAMWKRGLDELGIKHSLRTLLYMKVPAVRGGTFLQLICDNTKTVSNQELSYLIASMNTVNIPSLGNTVIAAIVQLFKEGLTTKQIELCIRAVCDANETKTAIKTLPHIKANICKGPNFIPPEKKIAKILAINSKPCTKESNSNKHTSMVSALTAYAEQSLCKKRKVAACLVNKKGLIVAIGHNRPACGETSCELPDGSTASHVIHAERDAIQKLAPKLAKEDLTMYVTHKPCDTCKGLINRAGIREVHIVNKFMKFDKDKLRYDLIPYESTLAEAQVLTYGAKKYKPNNWKQASDITRYIAAIYRHLEAWRAGELIDKESRLSHLAHAKTNIAFLIWFEANK